MSEQLAMVVRNNRLEAMGPRWRWWEMDSDHWVGYPDRRVKVTDLDDAWLKNILAYLAGWTEPRTDALVWAWWVRSAYFSSARTTEDGEDCIDTEMRQLAEQTHREWLEKFLVPCLPTLEAEARRRGFDVPTIPSYTCCFTKARAAFEAEWAAGEALRRGYHHEFPDPHPPVPEHPVRGVARRTGRRRGGARHRG